MNPNGPTSPYSTTNNLTTNTNSFLEQSIYNNATYKINNNQQFYIDGENILNEVRSHNITAELNNPFFYISNSLHFTKQQQQQNNTREQNQRDQAKANTPKRKGKVMVSTIAGLNS